MLKTFTTCTPWDLWKNLKKDPDSTAGIFFYEDLGGVDIVDGINNEKYKNWFISMDASYKWSAQLQRKN